jgi:hypothetical protein
MDVANSAIAVATVGLVVSLAMVPVAAWQEQREWEAFKANPANNCTYTGDYSEWPARMTVKGGNGWTCDDKEFGRKTYWRF